VNAYVLDASVAAKWFLPAAHETLTEQALRLFEDYAANRIRLVVPDLFWPEIGNILWKASRVGRISAESATQAVGALMAGEIPTSPSLPLLPVAFTIASAFRRSVYDSIYVSLAIASNRMFVTADERLANAVAAHFPVRWLGAL
jgi:predicted nucleic acid-binding protein